MPSYPQARVKRELCKRREEGRVPDIKFLACLLREAANEANDPVFGKLGVCSDRSQAAPVTQIRATSHRQSTLVATTAVMAPQSRHQSSDNSERQQPKSCVMCGEFHTLFGCDRFKSLSVNERIAFVKQKGLCFNCLLPNHQSANCPLTRRCSVNGCGRRHTKFLHVIKTTPQHELPASIVSVTSNATGVGVIMPSTQHELTASVASAANSTTLVESNATGAGSSVSALPVLPVIVRNPDTMVEIQAYALLDSGSTNSFCSSELVTKLNVRGHSSMLTLSTLGAEHTLVNTASVGLEVASIDKSAVLSLSEVFVRDKLLINLNNRAKPAEIQAWSHLKDITLSEANVSEVSLLIGQDCPEALVPGGETW